MNRIFNPELLPTDELVEALYALLADAPARSPLREDLSLSLPAAAPCFRADVE